EKAVMVLGFQEVKNIVLGKAVFNSFKELNSTNKKCIDSFWEHSFTCGLAAKVLAERFKLAPSEMFIAGLIHDIGKLAMLLTFPNIYSHLLTALEGNRLHNREKEIDLFFISHDEVALRILQRWLFPTRLIDAVGFHHHPHNAGEHQLLSLMVQMADSIASVFHSPGGSLAADRRVLMLNAQPDIFDLWKERQLSCTREEVTIWFNLLEVSREKDSAVLAAFTS
ncbi:MAG: HDOD domain-containing protein, partial [Desulfopila sp.]|nr:HDOD domain-containing protein [Desulfopila sp.]